MKQSKFILFLLLVLFSYSARAQEKSNTLFLFDNSGSMSGYYRESVSSFKSFSRALIKNSSVFSGDIKIMLFNKTDSKRGMQSPKVLFEGSAKTLILDQVMNSFTMMRANDGGFGTTDLIEIIDKAEEMLKGNTGIIWLVTDNINDNSGSGDSSYYNTLEFYKRIRVDDKLAKVLMYPIPETVIEEGYISKGYVVYGIVYSEKPVMQPELEKYDKIIRGIGIKYKPITLKPLDIGTIVLVPKITQSKISPAKLFYDGKALKGFDFEEGEKVRETFNDLTLKSNLFPYVIKSAKLDVKLDNFSSSDYSVKSLGTQTISPSTVSNVTPEGEVTGFSVIFNMPEITPTFSFNTIFKEDFAVSGNLILEVSQVDILLDNNFMNDLKELFALQSIPEIFQPVLKDKKITTSIPLEIRIKYGPWRLFVLIGIIAIFLAVVLFLVYIVVKKKCIIIIINENTTLNICLNSISSQSVYVDDLGELGKIKKSIGGSLKFTNSKLTSFPGKTIILVEGIPVEIEYDADNLRKNSVTIMYRNESTAKPGETNMNSDFY